jgi:hypothetical protein
MIIFGWESHTKNPTGSYKFCSRNEAVRDENMMQKDA